MINHHAIYQGYYFRWYKKKLVMDKHRPIKDRRPRPPLRGSFLEVSASWDRPYGVGDNLGGFENR